MLYIRSHWLGDQPLFRAFWMNLILLRAVILYAERFTRPPFVLEPQAAIAATAAFFVVCQLIVLPWQIVGVLRSCDRYLAQFRPIVWVWGIQIGVAASLILTLISVYSGFQSLYIDRRDRLEAAAPQRAQKRRSAVLCSPSTVAWNTEICSAPLTSRVSARAPRLTAKPPPPAVLRQIEQ